MFGKFLELISYILFSENILWQEFNNKYKTYRIKNGKKRVFCLNYILFIMLVEIFYRINLYPKEISKFNFVMKKKVTFIENLNKHNKR